MPGHAVSVGCVDFVLPPDQIARELERIAGHLAITRPKQLQPKADKTLPESEADLHRVFSLLRALTGVDFSYYKHTTLRRRIMRRMVLQKIEQLPKYVSYLQQNPGEVDLLFQD